MIKPRYLLAVLLVAFVQPLNVVGQFKTRHPVASGRIIESNYSQHSYENLAPLNQYAPSVVTATNAPVFMDKTAQFLNETRSKMASGICYTEVPTASLVKTLNSVPTGNGSTPTLSRVQVCCEGYERNPHVYSRCDPICKDDCPNGMCAAPNTCVCLPGNIRDHEGRCYPTCPIGCRNGRCQPDDSCKCNAGYELDLDTRQFCRPHCTKGCDFGRCVAPDQCECEPNYQLSPEGVCKPKCDNCGHGTCSAPGLCICDRGYIRQNDACEPICDKGCEKGTCTAPNVCTCKPGWVLDSTGTSCMAFCEMACLNGYCDGPNKCTCNFGYIQDENNWNACKAHCPSGCPNGFCSGPNFCICKPGYIKSGVKGRQTCVSVA